MKYGKRAISLALAAVLLAGSLAGTPAEAAEAADVLYLPYYTPTATASQNEGTGWVRVRTGEFPQKYNLINQWGGAAAGGRLRGCGGIFRRTALCPAGGTHRFS